MGEQAQASGVVTIGGRQVPRIGYGLGGLSRGAEDQQGIERGVELLRHALEQGVTFYDTAEFYENGRANALLAAAFGDRRDEVFYATKVGARPVVDGPFPMTAAQRPDELRDAVEANLQSLGTDRLDLVYLRRMDMTPGLVVSGEQQVPLDDQLEALVALREAGTIGAIGLSHVTAEQYRQAAPAGIAAVSNIYNMLGRGDEDLLQATIADGAVWAPYFPLGGGGWAGLPRVTEHPVVVECAAELGVTTNQLGLAWLLAHAPNSLVIAGTSSTGHLDENVGAAAVRIPQGMLPRLDDLAAQQ